MLHKTLLIVLLAVIAGFGSVFFLNNKESSVLKSDGIQLVAEDHILGNRSASVKIVEYAEVECQYCKKLQPTLLRILSEYDGRVAFVYRHFPLTIHPKSFNQATALECVAESKGDSGFFEYLDKLYEATPSNNNIDLAVLPRLALGMGIQEAGFMECLNSDRYGKRILHDIEIGMGLNVDSVPHLIILAPNGKQFVFGKSPSYSALRAVVETALNEK